MLDKNIWGEPLSYEYSTAANPILPPIPINSFPPFSQFQGCNGIYPFDLSKELGSKGPASSPNLLSGYIIITAKETVITKPIATSQLFFVIRGHGETLSKYGRLSWKEGDLFTIPGDIECHHESGMHESSLYFVHDAPLVRYLGVKPTRDSFKPTFYSKEYLMTEMQKVIKSDESKPKNRMGIILGNERPITVQNRTITPVLWVILDVIPPGKVQPAHRHNSVALDFCISASKGAYTLLGQELDDKGNIKDPVRVEWETGSIFITPPGWWHEHHNDSNTEAWVLPVQDAGLYTHQRVLDIRFAVDEVKKMKETLAQSQ